MSTNKTRLCWSCEGNVEAQLSKCPYCGVELQPLGEESPSGLGEVEETTAPYYAASSPALQEEWNQAVGASLEEKTEGESKEAHMLYALLFLLSGSVFLLFGGMLLFFSHDGEFILRWSASYWMLYLGLGLPLLYLGWRSLKTLSP